MPYLCRAIYDARRIALTRAARLNRCRGHRDASKGKPNPGHVAAVATDDAMDVVRPGFEFFVKRLTGAFVQPLLGCTVVNCAENGKRAAKAACPVRHCVTLGSI